MPYEYEHGYITWETTATINIYNWNSSATSCGGSGAQWTWPCSSADDDGWYHVGHIRGDDEPSCEPPAMGRLQREEQARVEAGDRAVLLLRSILTAEQCASMDEHGYFVVTGSAGGRYRIRLHTSNGNIEWLREDDRVGGRICAHPTMTEHWLPMADVALAQLLALTTDERAFAALANLHEGEWPPVLQRRPRQERRLRQPLAV